MRMKRLKCLIKTTRIALQEIQHTSRVSTPPNTPQEVLPGSGETPLLDTAWLDRLALNI